MADHRMISISFWENESIAALTIQQRLLFLGLVCNADAQGRLKGNPALVRRAVFPLDDIPLETIRADLEAIAAIGSVLLYQVEGRQYIQVTGWWKHQHLQWAYPSPIPPPPGWTDHLRYREGKEILEDNWPVRGKQAASSEPASEALAETPAEPPAKALAKALAENLPVEITKPTESGRESESDPKKERSANADAERSAGADAGCSPAPPLDPPLSLSPLNRTPKAGGARLQPSLSPGQSALLQAFGAKRFKTDIQRQAVLELEKQYGFDRLQEGITWAAKKGIHLSTAISALETALPKWGQPKASAVVAPEQREEEARRSREMRLNAKPVQEWPTRIPLTTKDTKDTKV